jgi:hypothetical protein
MYDDFSKLVEQVEKQRAEKVAKFLELLRDPDLATYVALLRNGEQPERAKQPFIAPTGFKSGNGIQKTVASLTLPEQFTGEDVLRALEEAKFVFSSKDHKGAVRDALSSLTRGETPKFRIVHKGEGGKPNFYERISGGSWD